MQAQSGKDRDNSAIFGDKPSFNRTVTQHFLMLPIGKTKTNTGSKTTLNMMTFGIHGITNYRLSKRKLIIEMADTQMSCEHNKMTAELSTLSRAWPTIKLRGCYNTESINPRPDGPLDFPPLDGGGC